MYLQIPANFEGEEEKRVPEETVRITKVTAGFPREEILHPSDTFRLLRDTGRFPIVLGRNNFESALIEPEEN